jgi:hypothetical protein
MSLSGLWLWLASSLAILAIAALAYAIFLHRSWRISQWATRSFRQIRATATGVWRKPWFGIKSALATRRRRFSAGLAVVMIGAVAWLTLGSFTGQSTSAMVIVDQLAAPGAPIDVSSVTVDRSASVAEQARQNRVHQGACVLAGAAVIGLVWTFLSCRAGRG